MKLFTNFLFFLVLSFNSILFAQAPPSQALNIGKITGVVVDSSSGEALEFATISIYKAGSANNELLGGGITDAKGKFKIEEIPLGNLRIVANFIGYRAKEVITLKLSAESPTQNLGEIKLSMGDGVLDAAEVVADNQVFQLALDKKIFNVEKTNLGQSENATEVLRQTPTVEVDGEGNVKIRGSAVQVFINGKPTGLRGESQAAILEQLPANTIKSIELITSPSAKYDPEGEAGIINIILKKNSLEGFTGSAIVSAGTWGNKYRSDFNLNYRNKWVNITSSLGYDYNGRWSRGESHRENIFQDTSYSVDQINGGIRNRSRLSARIGADFYLDKNNTLSISTNLRPSSRNSTDSTVYQYFDVQDILSNIDKRNTIGSSQRFDQTYNMTYTHLFANKKPATGEAPRGMGEQKELMVDLQYSKGRDADQDEYIQQLYLPNSELANNTPTLQNTNNLANNFDAMLRIDYTHPFSKDQKLEVGYKGTYRSDRQNFYSERFEYNSNTFMPDSALNNEYQYTEHIEAVYATYGQKFKKLGIKAGLRVEQTFMNSKLFNDNSSFQNNYLSFFPSLNVSYSINESQQMQVSYSRRINRPNSWNTNPFANYSDPLNLRYGNPFLLPSFSNAFELSYVKYWKFGSLIATGFYRYNTGLIERINSLREDGVGVQTYANFSNSHSYGLEMSGRFQVFKWWSITPSISVFQQIQDASNIDASFKSSAIAGNGSVNMDFQLPYNFKINLSYWSSIPTRAVQGRTSGYYHNSINFSKSFLENKATLSLNIQNPVLGGRWSYEAEGSNFKQSTLRRWEAPIAYLRFNYRFGKVNNKDRRPSRRSSGMERGDGDGMMD